MIYLLSIKYIWHSLHVLLSSSLTHIWPLLCLFKLISYKLFELTFGLITLKLVKFTQTYTISKLVHLIKYETQVFGYFTIQFYFLFSTISEFKQKILSLAWCLVFVWDGIFIATFLLTIRWIKVIFYLKVKYNLLLHMFDYMYKQLVTMFIARFKSAKKN